MNPTSFTKPGAMIGFEAMDFLFVIEPPYSARRVKSLAMIIPQQLQLRDYNLLWLLTIAY